ALSVSSVPVPSASSVPDNSERMSEPEVHRPTGIEGTWIHGEAQVESQQTDGRVHADAGSASYLNPGMQDVADRRIDVPEIDEANASDPPVDGKSQFTVGDQHR